MSIIENLKKYDKAANLVKSQDRNEREEGVQIAIELQKLDTLYETLLCEKIELLEAGKNCRTILKPINQAIETIKPWITNFRTQSYMYKALEKGTVFTYRWKDVKKERPPSGIAVMVRVEREIEQTYWDHELNSQISQKSNYFISTIGIFQNNTWKTLVNLHDEKQMINKVVAMYGEEPTHWSKLPQTKYV